MKENEFTDLYHRHKDTVYRIAFTYMKNSADALDIVQEAMIRLYRHRRSFESSEHCRRWLIRVTVNLAKDMLRRERFIDGSEPDFSGFASLADHDRQILEEILKLPAEYRSVIFLHYYEGYTYAETAGLLGISESAVKMRAKRARETLKDAFQQEE